MSTRIYAVKSLLSACLATVPRHHGNWYGSCPCYSRRVNPINTFAAQQRRCVHRQRRLSAWEARHACIAAYYFYEQREISVSDERNKNKPGVSRRGFLKGVGAAVGGAALIGATPSWLRSTAWAAGSAKPEKTDLTIGFIPLTDCASVVMAYELGLYKKYGLNVTVSKEASWAAVRDKLVHGELDAAHVLY